MSPAGKLPFETPFGKLRAGRTNRRYESRDWVCRLHVAAYNLQTAAPPCAICAQIAYGEQDYFLVYLRQSMTSAFLQCIEQACERRYPLDAKEHLCGMWRAAGRTLRFLGESILAAAKAMAAAQR